MNGIYLEYAKYGKCQHCERIRTITAKNIRQ